MVCMLVTVDMIKVKIFGMYMHDVDISAKIN